MTWVINRLLYELCCFQEFPLFCCVETPTKTCGTSVMRSRDLRFPDATVLALLKVCLQSINHVASCHWAHLGPVTLQPCVQSFTCKPISWCWCCCSSRWHLEHTTPTPSQLLENGLIAASLSKSASLSYTSLDWYITMATTWMSLALSGAMRQQMRFLIEKSVLGSSDWEDMKWTYKIIPKVQKAESSSIFSQLC